MTYPAVVATSKQLNKLFDANVAQLDKEKSGLTGLDFSEGKGRTALNIFH